MTDEQCRLALAEAFRVERRRRIRTRRLAAVLGIALIFSLTATTALVKSANSSCIGGGSDQPAAAFSARAK